MAVIMLCDNGSVRANATLQLRRLAKGLGEKTGHPVHAVSFKHANRIAVEEIDGIPAQVFRSFMTEQLAQGQRDFILLPLFFGNSKALTSFVPDEVAALTEKFGEFKLAIAEVIYPLPQGEPLLTAIIYDHIHDTASKHNLPLQNLVLVDHGSPVPRVTEVRKHLAQTVQQKLPADCQLEQAVMERREGKEYDFNGALLQDWLTEKAQAGERSAIVILMFFLAGRHAGEGGDIVDICNTVMEQNPGFKVAISPLITEHPDFVAILQKRLRDMM
jgi:sirohydrochlorin ferrochelatase